MDRSRVAAGRTLGHLSALRARNAWIRAIRAFLAVLDLEALGEEPRGRLLAQLEDLQARLERRRDDKDVEAKATTDDDGEQIERKLAQIARVPASGRPVPEDPGSGVREVIVMRWRIGYQAGASVNVLYVVHGHQLLPPLR